LMNMSPSKWNWESKRITTHALGRQAWNTTQEEPPPLKDSTWHSWHPKRKQWPIHAHACNENSCKLQK
jgi:hypothetical protein